MTPQILFEEALQKIESRSIRAWAQSDHNKPLIMKYCEGNPRLTPDDLAAFLVGVAIGLW